MENEKNATDRNYPTPLRLDLACGDRKEPGFVGVDNIKTSAVDVLHDLEVYPWPFDDDSVDEIRCIHYIEHVKDIMKFVDEMYRVMKVGSQALLFAPYYSSVRAWQDPTHIRPISEFSFLYYNKAWRISNKLDHYPIKSDFDFTYGYALHPEWVNRSEDAQQFAIKFYINVIQDIQVVLTKRAPEGK